MCVFVFIRMDGAGYQGNIHLMQRTSGNMIHLAGWERSSRCRNSLGRSQLSTTCTIWLSICLCQDKSISLQFVSRCQYFRWVVLLPLHDSCVSGNPHRPKEVYVVSSTTGWSVISLLLIIHMVLRQNCGK